MPSAAVADRDRVFRRCAYASGAYQPAYAHLLGVTALAKRPAANTGLTDAEIA